MGALKSTGLRDKVLRTPFSRALGLRLFGARGRTVFSKYLCDQRYRGGDAHSQKRPADGAALLRKSTGSGLAYCRKRQDLTQPLSTTFGMREEHMGSD
jgi:hypothetical protein